MVEENVEKSAFEPDSPVQSQPAQADQDEYKFMQTLDFHSGTVRSLCVVDNILMSGSIDMTNKTYNLNQAIGKYNFGKELKYHDGHVLDICPQIGGTGFFSAGRDKKMILIDTEGSPVMEFIGHEQAVNSVSQAIPDEVVTGSWDGTAKIWDVATGKCKETLTGHSHAVAVLTLPNGITITGSQDKKIRMWFGGQQNKEFEAHDDIVRGFCEVPQIQGFASCSNDETVKLWAMDGSALQTLKGHTSFVFAIDCLPTGEIISAGDDCCAKVWKDGACAQTIQMPKTCWSIKHNKMSDIIVGCEDKTIRIFTRDSTRADDGPEFEKFEKAIKDKALP